MKYEPRYVQGPSWNYDSVGLTTGGKRLLLGNGSPSSFFSQLPHAATTANCITFPGRFPGTRARRIGRCILGGRVLHPHAIHHEKVFVAARRQVQFLHPFAVLSGNHGKSGGMPIIERAGQEDRAGFGADKFKAGGAC